MMTETEILERRITELTLENDNLHRMVRGDSDKLSLPKRGHSTPQPSSSEAARIRLLHAVRYFYDLQRLRIQAGGRQTPKAVSAEAELSEEDLKFFGDTSHNINALERMALREISDLLDFFPISKWLLEQRGVGPTMAGVIISSFDIHRANTASAMWAVSGLSVKDGKAPRPKKGEKLTYNAWLRTKMVGVLAGNFLKLKSPWREFYDNYKTRKENQIVDVCMACNGKDSTKCRNCTGGPAPWGCSPGHRHNASLRYMAKMFLLELHKEWRTIEGLEVRAPYAEEYLGRKHHENSSAGPP
jgi:hypothetical protein